MVIAAHAKMPKNPFGIFIEFPIEKLCPSKMFDNRLELLMIFGIESVL